MAPHPLALVSGQQIRVVGLRARTELNGLEGVLQSFDAEEQRWEVEFHGGRGRTTLRSENLELAEPAVERPSACTSSTGVATGALAKTSPRACQRCVGSFTLSKLGARVHVCHLIQRPDLNGQAGILHEYIPKEDRWKVYMDDGSGKVFRSCNLCFEITDHYSLSQCSCHQRYLRRPSEDAQSSVRVCPLASGVQDDFSGEFRLVPGARVQVDGLQVKKHLNGLKGNLVSFDIEEDRWNVLLDGGSEMMLRSIHLTLVAADLEPSVRPVACGFLPGTRVITTGLIARPELNGRSGVVETFDACENRWRVRMDDGSGKLLRAVNLDFLQEQRWPGGHPQQQRQGEGGSKKEVVNEFGTSRSPPVLTTPDAASAFGLGPGAHVRVNGLQSQVFLNGQIGSVICFDYIEQRFRVRMKDGSGKLLKRENLYPILERESDWCHISEDYAPDVRGQSWYGPNSVRSCISKCNDMHQKESEARSVEIGCRVKENGLAPPGGTENSFVVGTKEVETLLPPASSPPSVSSSTSTYPSRLATGFRIRVDGLRGRPEVNGQEGVLVGFDSVENRWRVRMDDGSGKLLRCENLVSLELASPEQTAACASDGGQTARNGELSRQHQVDAAMFKEGGCVESLTLEPEGTNFDCCARPAMGARSELFSGARVVLRGLLSRPDLNDLEGVLVAFDTFEDRWQVRMDDGTGKLLRASNLQLLLAPGLVDQSNDSLGERMKGAVALDNGGVMASSLVEGKETNVSGERSCSLSDQTSLVCNVQQRLIPGARVSVCGLTGRTDLNGQEGTLVAFDTSLARWRVLMDDGTGKLLREAHLNVTTPDRPGSSNAVIEDPLFSPGKRVRVQGLIARPELNGQMGSLMSFDSSESRWRVRMDDGSGKLLREETLRVVVPNEAAADCHIGVVTHPLDTGCNHSPLNIREVCHPLSATNVPVGGISRDVLLTSTMSCRYRMFLTAGERMVVPGEPALQIGSRVEAFHDWRELGVIVERKAGDGLWEVHLSDGSRRTFLSEDLIQVYQNPSQSSTARLSRQFARQVQNESVGLGSVVRLAPGSRVVVEGLKARSDLNGQTGVLVSFDCAENRWRVQMDDGSGKLLREASLRLVEPPTCLSNTPASASSTTSTAGMFSLGSRVRVCGLKSRAELNGQVGTIVDYDSADDRWKVFMEDGCGKAFKAINLEAAGDMLAGMTPDRSRAVKGVELCAEVSYTALDGASSPVSGSPMPQAASQSALSSRRECAQSPAPELARGMRVRVQRLQARPDLNGCEGTLADYDSEARRWQVMFDKGFGKLLREANLEAVRTTIVNQV